MLKLKIFVIGLLFFMGVDCLAQEEQTNNNDKNKSFWKNVHFGGGIQLSIGNGYTAIGVSPSAIYEVSEEFAAGLGVSYLYSKTRYSDFGYNIFGGSALALYNPIKQIQLSTEFEEMYVSTNSEETNSYWLPAWYLGLAYSMGNRSAIGIRYDVLYDEERSIYDSALTPFIRIYF